jgi:hypothetical protein
MTVRCANGHDNPDGQSYCGECGTPLASESPSTETQTVSTTRWWRNRWAIASLAGALVLGGAGIAAGLLIESSGGGAGWTKAQRSPLPDVAYDAAASTNGTVSMFTDWQCASRKVVAAYPDYSDFAKLTAELRRDAVLNAAQNCPLELRPCNGPTDLEGYAGGSPCRYQRSRSSPPVVLGVPPERP